MDETPDDKPGIRTSEFWLSLTATIVGALIAFLAEFDDPTVTMVVKGLGLVASILSTLGYTGGRTLLKRARLYANASQARQAKEAS